MATKHSGAQFIGNITFSATSFGVQGKTVTYTVAPTGTAADYNTTGTSDNVQINAALTAANAGGGGTVVLLPGHTYNISTSIVINSNTTLIAYGATISFDNNPGTTLLIDTQNNGGSAVSNITVLGGIWTIPNDAANGSFPMVRLGGANLVIRDMSVTNPAGNHTGFAFSVKNATDFYVENIYINSNASDGFHVDGPCARGVVKNIHGVAYDDFVVIGNTSRNNVGTIEAGDVTDILIDGITVNNFYRANPFKILSGNVNSVVYNIKRIHVKNITGTCIAGFQSGIYIGDDPGFTGTFNGQIDNITVEDVSLKFPSGGTVVPVFYFKGSATSLTIPNITINNVQIDGDTSGIFQLQLAKITNLTINNVQGTTATEGMTGVVYFAGGTSGTSVTNLTLNNFFLTSAGAAAGQLVNTLTTGDTLTNLFANNIYLNNFSKLSDTAISTNYYLHSIRLVGDGEVFHLRATTNAVIQSCTGLVADTASSSIIAGGTLESKSYNFPIDVGLTGIVTTTGDMAYNTNGARTCGVGPVGYNGTHWYNSLSGATF